MDHHEDESQLCDDGSFFISACHSAVTHFFGHEHEDDKNDNGNGSGGSPPDKEQSSSSSNGLPAIGLSNSMPDSSFFTDDSLRLFNRARSMSPSLSVSPDEEDLYQHSAYYCGSEDTSDRWTTGYFDTSDFNTQTWMKLIDTEAIQFCGAGAAILTAAVIVHPVALIGAATAAVGASAVWAVGRFHDLDTGYQIWNNEDFGMLFWEEQTMALEDDAANNNNNASPAIATVGSQQIIQQNEEELRQAFLLEQQQIQRKKSLGDNDVHEIDRQVIASPQQQQHNDVSNVEKKLQSISLQETNRLIRVNTAPVKELSTLPPPLKSSPMRTSKQPHTLQNKATQHPTTLPPTILSTQQSLDRHYPPLQNRVVNQIKFQGLNTHEFFQVFFSDDAPYSMKIFQQKRGDVDIHYNNWNDIADDHVPHLTSFKSGLLPLPSNSTRERTLTFNTLTKSYFGPAYARATKVQRATQLSKHLLIIENETQLSEVPFSDRFKILERWIIEAVKSDLGLYTCKLTVDAEVVMISPCKFEHQIRKKAIETFTDLTNGWCKLATKALEATKEQKRKRMRNEQLDVVESSGDNVMMMERMRMKKSRVSDESVLFARHQKKFQELDDLISHDDVGIEVMHSLKAGAHSAFAKVLEPSSSTSGVIKLKDGTVVEVARRMRSRDGGMTRRMHRTLLRKLSSRVPSFSKQSR